MSTRSAALDERGDQIVDRVRSLQVQEVPGAPHHLESARRPEKIAGAARDRGQLTSIALAVQVEERGRGNVQQMRLLGAYCLARIQGRRNAR
jgi:hypothetical protein